MRIEMPSELIFVRTTGLANKNRAKGNEKPFQFPKETILSPNCCHLPYPVL